MKAVKKKSLLIHVALFHEAKPLIKNLGLKQYDTSPYRVFKSEKIDLIVSGLGGENTALALKWILNKESYDCCLNFGTAACSDDSIKIGTPAFVSKIFFENRTVFTSNLQLSDKNNICIMPLETVTKPKTRWENGTSDLLADMEGAFFVKSLSVIDDKNIIVLIKVISDYGSDKILSKDQLQTIIVSSLENGVLNVIDELCNFKPGLEKNK
ncbi:MAG: hypothetical protein JXR91_01020 [Deltaproteobacteria bacterium]|nr:hypothetical protein [Deltaproteobacteria bacterium]